jgi:hypothetical protein
MAEELVRDADQRGYHAKAGTLASIRWHLHQMLLAKQVVVTNEPEMLSDAEAEEEIIDLTPLDMEAPEGVDRVNIAWKQYEDTARKFASKAGSFVEDYSQNLDDMVAKEAENNESIRDDWSQIQALLGGYRRGQEAFLHTVAGSSPPSREYEAEMLSVGNTPTCEGRGEPENHCKCEDLVPHRNVTADRDTMENPWLNLNSSAPPYVLEMDREYVQRHNERSRPEHMLMLEAIPEPFIGDPKTAKVVLLNLNPGYDDTVVANHHRPEIKQAILCNLRHEPQRYPFYAFDPVFAGTGVANYWREYTHRLQDEARLDDLKFAKRLLVIEWFPYPSYRGGLPSEPVCESQKYSFQLAKRMLAKRGVQVVGTRSPERWLQAGQEFSRVPFLNNPQRAWVTRGNMDARVFDRVIQALNEEDDV